MTRNRINVTSLTREERREYVFKHALRVHEPYKLFHSPVRSQGWVLIYQDPQTKERRIVLGYIEDRQTGLDLKEIVEKAWLEGYTAAKQE